MDVATYLQCFENSLTSYTGEDPLDPWDKFVEYLEQRLPADRSSGMSLVFDSLVQRFLNVERYANDVRFVNHCIKCASYYSDPIALYSHIFSKGVGTRTAALYVAWAQQFEQRGLREQAEAVFQKAVENQAQPVDTVLHEYRQFQTRTRTQTAPSEAGARTPLQDSQLTNQMSSHREPHNKASVSERQSKPPVNEMAIIVSRSETSATIPSNKGSGVQTVSEYMTDELLCEGSEFCFEEVRAEKYFRKLREKQEREQREIMERRLREQEEEGTQSLTCLLKTVSQVLGGSRDFEIQASSHRRPAVEPADGLNPDPTQHASGRPRPSHRPSSRVSLGLRLHSEPAFIRPQEAAAVPEPPPQQSSEVSHHASVLAERSLHVPRPEAPADPADQDFVVQVSMVRNPDHIPAVVLSQDSGVQPSGSDHRRPQQHHATHTDVGQPPEPEEKLDVSQGGTANLSHITPNSSLGFVPATPSRALPSPTVNTREALGVIMDMFQAPTFLEETFGSTSVLHGAEKQFEAERSRNGPAPSTARPPPTAPFAIFQDDSDKENGRAAAAASCGPDKSKPIRALAEITATKTEKPNDSPPDLMPDDSTMWGAHYNSLHSLAACPNSTTDFAMLAAFVSTPFTHKTPVSCYQDQENNCDGGDGDDDAFIRRQQKKLSPIMEQSPCNDIAVSQLLPPSARQGTIVGEGHCLTSSSITMVQPPPPAVLSFRDQTLCPTDSSRTFTATTTTTVTEPGWEVYTSPEHPPKPLISARPRNESFKVMEDPDKPASPERVQKPVCYVPMSPDCAVRPDWLVIRSPEAAVEPDLDAFLSPCRPKKANATSAGVLDVPMSPEQPQICSVDEPMMSPDRRPSADVSMNATAAAAVQLVSDPWNDELISQLLSSLAPPLTSHPRCITWQCNVPAIAPKTTISMGKASLRVDGVLGKGAFATVYQATDPVTSERVVLKVQKPANPWEFYINTRLDARLQPDVRQLFGSISSAHLFHNGSVLLGELHNYGTLLNAVNIYRTQSDRVMPQPLVIYFTVCILHMVEQLHAANIIHADIKPDNFMLGERFLENRCFDPESSDHGLVLIDLGQSIDMELFPEGTAFTAKCLTSGFQCTEMLSGRPWSYQTDYFGVAGTVYCMLFGTYMQVTHEDGVWKTNGVFRRNPHTDLWLHFFHSLLNVSDCDSAPSLRDLRLQLTSVLQQNYSSKLPTLKSRLVVLLLEGHRAARR